MKLDFFKIHRNGQKLIVYYRCRSISLNLSASLCVLCGEIFLETIDEETEVETGNP